MSVSRCEELDSNENFTRSRHAKRCMRGSKLFACAVVLVILYTSVVEAVDEVVRNIDIEQLNKCEESSPDNPIARVIVGWPFRIDCQQQIASLDSNYYYLEDYPTNVSEINLQCIIMSGGKIVDVANVSTPGGESYYLYDQHSDPYVVSNVAPNLNGTVYTSILTDGSENCTKVSYTLLVEQPEEQKSCKSATFSTFLNREIVEGQLHQIQCIAPTNAFYLDTESYQVTWYKDCQELKRITKTGKTGAGEIIVDALELVEVNFKTTPGEYTCSVTYNGYEMYMTKIDVCVKYGTPSGQPLFHHLSLEKPRVQSGENVTLTCGGFANSVSTFSFAVSWYKNTTNGTSQFLCTASHFSPDGQSEANAKYHCNMLSNAAQISTCYTDYEEAQKDPYKGILRVNSSFTIRDFQASDAGQYICRVISTRAPEVVTFEIELQSRNLLIIILPTVFGFVLLLVIFLVVFFCIRRNCLQKHYKNSPEKSSSSSSDQTQSFDKSSEIPSIDSSSTKEKDLPRDIV